MAKTLMEQDILKVLYSEEQLRARVTEMGEELKEKFEGKNPVFIGVLKGSFIFMADIVRACPIASDLEFIAVSSYQNSTTSSGVVQISEISGHQAASSGSAGAMLTCDVSAGWQSRCRACTAESNSCAGASSMCHTCMVAAVPLCHLLMLLSPWPSAASAARMPTVSSMLCHPCR